MKGEPQGRSGLILLAVAAAAVALLAVAVAFRRTGDARPLSKTAASETPAGQAAVPSQSASLDRYRDMNSGDLLGALQRTRSTFERRDILNVLGERKDSAAAETLADLLVDSRFDRCRKELLDALSACAPPGSEAFERTKARRTLGDPPSARGNPQEAIATLLGVLRSPTGDYERASIALKQLSGRVDFPILTRGTTPAEAARVADQWDKKLLESIGKETR